MIQFIQVPYLEDNRVLAMRLLFLFFGRLPAPPNVRTSVLLVMMLFNSIWALGICCCCYELGAGLMPVVGLRAFIVS